ncbi:hypothetical protein ERC79_08520 [Rhodococcus sp. ABRD24]|uniref:Tc toxin subunit A-related protein n=1 Tax=Rhodococcus sp. ABRD24 TaxID=2507582 RepID=UPI00103A7605|nr:hypothetical protein [Rhodococcus sp. ABRD24]QBJ96010.1 hypothetical protein ERC79_08520 [Rhodococcus sp. ABRD24]
MGADADRLTVRVQVHHRATGWPIAEAPVEIALDDLVIADAPTNADGLVALEIDSSAWRQGLTARLAGDRVGTPVVPAVLLGRAMAELFVMPTSAVDAGSYATLADHLVTSRRFRADDLARDLIRPDYDSVVRLLSVQERIRILDDLLEHLPEDRLSDGYNDHLIDPDALRQGTVQPVPVRDLDLDLDLDLEPFPLDPDSLGLPIWDRFPWSLPDDQSYRDYLRGALVLFAHQQKHGPSADPKKFPEVVERQLQVRFFQDFRTSERTEIPVNRMLIPIVQKILAAPTGSGFGFGIAADAIPTQGLISDREHLDVLLALAPVDVQEFSNRYRLPLAEPDSHMSSPVLLNVHTLSRILSDTAQGPIEPSDNVIDPQLPGERGKPFLWREVVGSAPFFLRYEEWLARQRPFFPENLFALRTQIVGNRVGPWLTEDRRNFLEYHRDRPDTWGIEAYKPYFGSIDEVRRSATFLLAYGATDTKLLELVAAIDKGQFRAAARLADEADRLLDAGPSTKPGEDWEPTLSVGNFPRPVSFGKRRALKVTTITELTGTRASYPPDGFEQYFELATPSALDGGLYGDVVDFRIARDQATRLRVYQKRYLLPMLRVQIHIGLGDLQGAVDTAASVTGFFVGIGTPGTPAGMVRHPNAGAVIATRVVAGKLVWNEQLGDRPYTARLVYDNDRRLDGPYSLTPQFRDGYDVLTADPKILHPLEERYARIVQADALLAWAETLYRTDESANLERARELYKAVVFLHGEDPGTSAYRPPQFQVPWFVTAENPRVRNQLDRARLALQQLESGLNFYGYREDTVPILRFKTLFGAAHRWATGAKGAQSDYLTYLSRVEQADLDQMAAKAQERRAQAAVVIAAEQVEIAKAGVAVAQKLVSDVDKLIAAKESEIADKNSIFNQFSDYFSGMKSSVSSMVDVGKTASEGYTAVSTSGVGEALGLGANAGTTAAANTSGLGSAMGGLGVVGGFAAFAVLSTTALQGMADAATKREAELNALKTEILPAAQAAVQVQERHAAIADLQGRIAATDLAYARDLAAYQNERFLNRDFWDALAGVARRGMHRYLSLASQAAWFAERALAYQLATPIRIVKLDYFDARMRDLGGVDRLALDLAELEAVRLGAARVSVPIKRTYSMARDLPLAFGQLKQSGRCTFTLTDDDLTTSHPGTFAHRIRAVDVRVETPGTVEQTRGILTNQGFSLLRRASDAARVPLLRFADAQPISEFRVHSDSDLALHGMPGESLLPFEGTAFTTTWSLELPPRANPAGLHRVTDVLITFDLQAAYGTDSVEVANPPATASRSLFVSALAVDSPGLATLRKKNATAKVTFPLGELPIPHPAKITNLAILVPGVDGGSYAATLRTGGGASIPFILDDGLAMSNAGVLGDGNPLTALPLNAAAGVSIPPTMVVTVTKGNDATRLAAARDLLLWVEYDVTV